MSVAPPSLFPPFPLADYAHHRGAIAAALERVLARGQYVLGEEVGGFEAEFATWLGARHVVGTASGTDAIELMLRALDIGVGARVIVPALSPSAVAAAVHRAGAEVLFADVEPDTWTMCAQSLNAVLSSEAGRQAKAVLAVHLHGQPVAWSALQAVADAHGVLLLEDGSQAHGARWEGVAIGTLGHAAAFSFYPTKNLAALGDAGAVVTSDESLAARLRSLRQYGWQERYISVERGVNSRLDEVQAAVLRVKLRNLTAHQARRQALAQVYRRHLSQDAPTLRGGCEHGWHLHVIQCSRRHVLLGRLLASGVPASVQGPTALNRQPAFANGQSMPVAEAAAGTLLALPLHPYLSQEAIEFACDALR